MPWFPQSTPCVCQISPPWPSASAAIIKHHFLTILEVSTVQDQEAEKLGIWWDLSFWCSGGHILCPRLALSLCVRQSELFSVSSYKDTNPVGSELHPYDLINLNYFLRGPTSKESHPGRVGLGGDWSFNIWIWEVTKPFSAQHWPRRPGSSSSQNHLLWPQENESFR